MYYVYILKSDSGRFYIGQTDNLDRHLYQHNNDIFINKNSFTNHLKGTWHLVYYESFDTRSDAVKREKQIKSWKSKVMINKLINGDNPVNR